MIDTNWTPFQRIPFWSLTTVVIVAGIIPAQRKRNHSDRKHAGINWKADPFRGGGLMGPFSSGAGMTAASPETT